MHASKLPKLQAALAKETSQADDNQLQSASLQIEASQLRARLQALQNRHHKTTALVDNLEQQLRHCKLELGKRSSTVAQVNEKNQALEQELAHVRQTHAHDIHQLKQRFQRTTNRIENESSKRLKDTTHQLEHRIRELRAKALKNQRRCRELETHVAHLEEQEGEQKQAIKATEDHSRRQARDIVSLERKLERVYENEAHLKAQIAHLKAKLSITQTTAHTRLQCRDGHGRRNPADIKMRQAFTAQKRPAERIDLLTQEPIHIDKLKDENSHLIARVQTLEEQLTSAQLEVHRLRVMHARELKVQAEAFKFALVPNLA